MLSEALSEIYVPYDNEPKLLPSFLPRAFKNNLFSLLSFFNYF